MQDDVAMSTAARQLGLSRGAMALAVQLGEVCTVPAVSAVHAAGAEHAVSRVAGGGQPPRRVTRAELARLQDAEDFPDGLRERLRVVDGGGGARLLGVTTARFARLARGGCFSPVRFYVNRYGTVVWLYPETELRAFAESRPELLAGRLPRGLRMLLAEGVDLRAGHWRGRRVGTLCREADGPWEAAAARAALLSEEALEEAVPDAGERARLSALRPELAPFRARSAAVREVVEALCKAAGEDEVFWQRLMLAADLESARASDESAATAVAAGPARPSAPAGGAVVTGEPYGGRGAAKAQTSPPVRRHSAGRGSPCPGAGAGRARTRAVERRARALTGLRARRQRPVPSRPDVLRARRRGLSRPAF